MLGKSLAQIGYEAYGAFVKWKNYAGQPMPAWGELPNGIQMAWREATRAVKDAQRRVDPRVQVVAHIIASGSVGYTWKENAQVYFDISGLHISEDEFKAVAQALREAIFYV